jgi:hypothetical protein
MSTKDISAFTGGRDLLMVIRYAAIQDISAFSGSRDQREVAYDCKAGKKDLNLSGSGGRLEYRKYFENGPAR